MNSTFTTPRFSAYKRFKEDLWGLMLLSPKPASIPILCSLLRRHRPVKRSVRLLLPPRQPLRGRRKAPPSFFKRQLLERRKVQLFYAFNRYYRLRVLLNHYNSARPPCSFFSYIETCLSSVLFRSLLVRTPLEARSVISKGCVTVDGVVCFSSIQRVRPGQLVTLLLPAALPSRYNRLFHKTPPIGFPPYLEVSFSTNTVILLHLPEKEELFFPFRLSPSDFFASFAR